MWWSIEELARCDTGGRVATAIKAAVTFETVIGLEVHTQLSTQSKMYCGCTADYANAEPNTHTCPICLGLPGALPAINRAAIEFALRTGLALKCTIADYCKFDRKNYVYPDLPKGYQISQYDLPLATSGLLKFNSNGMSISAGITRVHLEEDTGRLVHRDSSASGNRSLVDFNRSGVPLMEIVSDPDLRSPEQARDYLIALRQILRYIGVSSGNMEEGAFRCDANVSIRSDDGALVGAKVEIKNMNSFRAVEHALRFEEQRQRSELSGGGLIIQETRGWVEESGKTVPQRTKEQAHDYRYFPEPDLPPLAFSGEMVTEVRSRIPELPAERKTRLRRDYGINDGDATLITQEQTIADVFEEVAAPLQESDGGRMVANWLLNDILGLQKHRGLPAGTLPLSVAQFQDFILLIRRGDVTGRAAKELLPKLLDDELPSAAAIRLKLMSLHDSAEVRDAAVQTLREQPLAVADFRAGKTAALGRLLGETIKRTGGRANPEEVRRILLEILSDE
ncbi:MAG: Asp-tRNA(Asn)/Glu-tRNA(Gln) amidotransferase subunit GatB [Chloroflexia bacterium]|nr:Asp-tRNA(Asn)/Glu-tRNA(Gln) amidotransferase subunit GatB [Chloroflexia bacterium]